MKWKGHWKHIHLTILWLLLGVCCCRFKKGPGKIVFHILQLFFGVPKGRLSQKGYKILPARFEPAPGLLPIGRTWPYFHGKAFKKQPIIYLIRLDLRWFFSELVSYIPVGDSMAPPLEAQFSVFISVSFFSATRATGKTTVFEQRQSSIVHISSPPHPNLYPIHSLPERRVIFFSARPLLV